MMVSEANEMNAVVVADVKRKFRKKKWPCSIIASDLCVNLQFADHLVVYCHQLYKTLFGPVSDVNNSTPMKTAGLIRSH